ncbi:MAG: hypothetical protein MZU95_08560 [Desulfomicrobium escambiense]|nr:hypothetical protein [Desulfomicrobium escambiense]
MVKVRLRQARSVPDDAAVKAFVHDIALHIAAFSPMFLDRTKCRAGLAQGAGGDLPEAGRRRREDEGQARQRHRGHPQGQGQRSCMAEICLLDQGFVKDEKQHRRQGPGGHRQGRPGLRSPSSTIVVLQGRRELTVDVERRTVEPAARRGIDTDSDEGRYHGRRSRAPAKSG